MKQREDRMEREDGRQSGEREGGETENEQDFFLINTIRMCNGNTYIYIYRERVK